MNLTETLKDIEKKGLKRELFYLDQVGSTFSNNGKKYINFSSNDYLNLAVNNKIKKAAKKSIEKWGVGATGSRLMSGSLDSHKEIEQKLAQWCGYESALVFGSGFLTNLGVLSSLANKSDIVLFDKLNHASLIDGIIQSGAIWKRYKHKDIKNLTSLLEKNKDSKGQIFIVTDSVFSMDGDIAPLKEISELARQYNAILIVDEAHALGVFGKKGAGVCQQLKIKPDIITGTMSKSLGSYGGFVACSSETKKWFINKARSFVFSTALPSVCGDSAIAAIKVIEKEKKMGKTLIEIAKTFYQKLKVAGFSLLPFESQIIPVLVGNNEKTLKFSQALLGEGVFVKAIRPPTVPTGTSRIRLSITLGHTKKDLDKTLETMIKIGKKMGIIR